MVVSGYGDSLDWRSFQWAMETVDIMPTAAAILGLTPNFGRIDGHCRPEVAACATVQTVGTERGKR